MASRILFVFLLVLGLLGPESTRKVAAQECAAGEDGGAENCADPDVVVTSDTDESAKPADVRHQQETAETTTDSSDEDPHCPSRPHVIRCAAKYLDSNGNRLRPLC